MGRTNQQRRRAKAQQRRAHRNATEPRRATAGNDAAGGHATNSSAPGEASAMLEERSEAQQRVVDLLHALTSGHPREIEDALIALAECSADESGQRHVAVVFSDMLHQRLTWSWQHGWQPADLFRLAARKLESAEVRVLEDAVFTDLSRYAELTVEARWFAHLREAEAQRWWERDTDALRARGRSAAAGFSGVCEQAAKVLLLLAELPPLPMLGPPPGKAKRQEASAVPAAGVEERILTRVRLLLAKAESTTFEAEAETFTEGAQKLMAKHSIDVAMLEAHDGRAHSPASRRIGVDRPYENAKALLLTVVAEANRCRPVWSQEFGFMTVLGFEADLEATETLFTSLLVQSTQALQREGSRRDGIGGSRTRAFRSSFLTSYASRIGERLLEVTDAETQAAAETQATAEEQGDGQTGPAKTGELVRVLADRSEAVDAAKAEMFPNVRSRRATAPRDHEGWMSGRSAADRASIGAGRSHVGDGRKV